MKNINDYIDNFGMVVTKFDRDGGDSCAHGCAILYAAVRTMKLIPLLNLMRKYPSALEVELGLYCRHPNPDKWYSRNDTFSRDQLTPLIAYLSIIGVMAPIRRLFKQHLKRGLLFAWNTREIDSYPGQDNYKWKIPDITGPEIWAMWIRAFNCYTLYPLLFLFDIQTLISSILYRFKLTDSTLQMNHVLMVDFSNEVMPTLISKLAKWIYGKETPKAALTKSWGPEWQPPVDDFLIRLIDQQW